LHYELLSPNGYAGGLGELSVKPIYRSNLLPAQSFLCNYTAPNDAAAPIDIAARFSIYDPWAREKRMIEFTFHVTPV
jgi:hypothetical protein